MKAIKTHMQIQELLPWYATGTLNEDDMGAVATHLADCADCTDSVANAIRTAKAFHLSEETPPEADLERREAENFARLRLTSPAKSVQQHRPRQTLALAAMGLVAALLIGFSLSPQFLEEPFELMSRTNGGTDATVVQLLFHPQTSEQDMRLLLLDIDGEIVASPSPKGIYRVRLNHKADAAAYVVRLRQHPAVRWAEVEL